jgi:hypothetical protein
MKPFRILLAPAWLIAALLVPAAQAQQLEPRAYTNAPVGMNFVLAGYARSVGDVLPDPSVPAKDVNATLHTAVAGYARALDLFGKSGQIALLLPYAWGTASGTLEGQPRSVDRSGFGDPIMRLSMNFVGAPALSLKEFSTYTQDTIVGASIIVTAPWGRYDPTKVINIGTNRWSFKPELGVSHARGHWVFEGALAVAFFTDNDQFQVNRTREQAPLYSGQVHVVYNIRPGMWAAVDYTYYSGGRTTVDGQRRDDMLQSSRWGATFALPLDQRHSIKLYASTGVYARAGTDFRTVGVAWQYRWGAGL